MTVYRLSGELRLLVHKNTFDGLIRLGVCERAVTSAELQNEWLFHACCGGDVRRADVRVPVDGQTRGVGVEFLEHGGGHVEILAAYTNHFAVSVVRLSEMRSSRRRSWWVFPSVLQVRAL